MKAHISNDSLTSDDLATLEGSLNLFISNEIDGVSPEKKKENDLLALSVIQKLKNKENAFNAEDMRIMVVALSYFRIIITESNQSDESDSKFVKDSKKYLSIVDRLLAILKEKLSALGIQID